MTRSAASLFEELMAVDESSIIDAKTASRIDRSVLETVCAFANEPGLGGGHLLLGVARSSQGQRPGPDYEVVGVHDPDQLQSDFASQCATAFNRPIRPQIRVDRLGDAVVLVVFVPELAPTEKPLSLNRLGLPRGAFRRVGSTTQEGTDDDLIALYQGHQIDSYDGTPLKEASLADLDPEAIRAYRELRALANPVAEELAWNDTELLRALGAVVVEGEAPRPTVAGMLLFGTSMALRRCFPMMRIDYVRIPGREWVQDPGHRFDTIEIRAPLLLATRRAIAAVRDDLPATFSLPEGEAIRSDESILPSRVLREAIVNAVMHRSYRIHGAIQILRYANRLEIRNPGHSLKAEERLGEPGSQTRNRTYYVPGRAFVAAPPTPVSGDPHKLPGQPHKLPGQPHKLPGQPHKPAADPGELRTEPGDELPPALRRQLEGLGKKPPRPMVEDALVALCTWRPCSARELAGWLKDRDPRELTRAYLRPMVVQGRLAHTLPRMPNHPDQKYTLPPLHSRTES
jgi:ATP-dependent DNA helicase RecG